MIRGVATKSAQTQPEKTGPTTKMNPSPNPPKPKRGCAKHQHNRKEGGGKKGVTNATRVQGTKKSGPCYGPGKKAGGGMRAVGGGGGGGSSRTGKGGM